MRLRGGSKFCSKFTQPNVCVYAWVCYGTGGGLKVLVNACVLFCAYICTGQHGTERGERQCEKKDH